MEAWELALALAGSFVAGYVGSMLGLVLGTLRLPLIVVLSGSPLAAAGTNIAISAASAGAGAVRHAREGRVDWRVVAWMAPPSIVGRGRWGAARGQHLRAGALRGDRGGARLERDRPRVPARAGARSRAAAAGAGRARRLRDRRPRRGCRRHPRDAAHADARCAPSGWTSGGRRGRTSSSASSSASPASRRMRVRSESTGRSLAAGLAGAIPGGWLGARATGRLDEQTLRVALGAALVLVGAAFAVQAAL